MYFVLEHCEESGEERGQRLAPGDQGDPQRGKEGKFMMPFHFQFKASKKRKSHGTFLILHNCPFVVCRPFYRIF